MSLAEFTFTGRARPFVEIGIGDSRIPTPAGRWDVSRWDDPAATWSGVEPLWVDVSCDTRSFRCEYGRQRTTDRFVAGAASVVVDNSSGWADPRSPELGVLTMRPGRSIRMGIDHAVYGRRVLFRGFIDAMTPTYQPVDADTVELSCLDALGEINRAKLVPLGAPVGDGETVEVRIARILDLIGHPPSKRRLDPSSFTLVADVLGGQVADMLGRAAESGGGSVFGDQEANLVFRARDWQTYLPDEPVDGTIGNVDMTGTPGVPAADGYLTPTVGTVTTPDPGVPPTQCTLVFKVDGPTAQDQAVAGQWEGGNTWAVRRSANSQYVLYGSTDGSGVGISHTVYGPPIVAGPVFVALALTNVGTGMLSSWTSPDGVVWTKLADSATKPPITLYDSSGPVRVGAQGPGGLPWNGRIYSVELREGLDPTATTVPGYLTPTVGTVTTPDPGPLPSQCTFVWKVQGPNTAGAMTIAAQWEAGGNNSFSMAEDVTPGAFPVFYWNSTGGGSTSAFTVVGATVTAEPHFRACSLTFDTARIQAWSSLDGITWTAGNTGTRAAIPLFDSTSVLRIGSMGTATLTWPGRIYSVELRSGLDPAAGNVLWRFDADDYPGTGTSYVDPRGRTWTLTNAAAITPKRPALLWRFDANDYPGTGTSYVDPRGRTWTLSTAGAITPKAPAVPAVPPDVCPTGWERPFARADFATRVIVGRDAQTAQVLDDTPAQELYGIEPFERTDLLTLLDTKILDLGRRILVTRSAETAPRIRSVSLNARTAANALDLMATVDPYVPSRYRCRLRYPRGDVFDAEMFATGVAHEVTPSSWTLELNLDLADPYAAAGGQWDRVMWDRSTWTGVAP